MPLGMELGLSSGDFASDGDPAPPLNFRPIFIIVIVISFNFFMPAVFPPFCRASYGGTENARPENMARSKLQDWKTQDWKTRHQTTGLENARLELNAAPNCRTGKCEKRHVWKAKLRTPHVVVILVWC